jgi:hypothetical protein
MGPAGGDKLPPKPTLPNFPARETVQGLIQLVRAQDGFRGHTV